MAEGSCKAPAEKEDSQHTTDPEKTDETSPRDVADPDPDVTDLRHGEPVPAGFSSVLPPELREWGAAGL